MSWNEIAKLENEMYERAQKIEKLRKEAKPVPVKNYAFQSLTGKVTLLDLFGAKDKLIVIHNMGQGCRWCTAWADGINGILTHLESEFAVALVSKDAPELQRAFAQGRQWRYTMVSHGGGEYIAEQTVRPGETNMPGVVCYERNKDQIFRKNSSVFGPGDAFNPLFHLATLAGVGFEEFTPQYSYWRRPEKLDDGGARVNN
jgi:predicted dithiol-disulfide oxidoreductase (DUF899 family)